MKNVDINKIVVSKNISFGKTIFFKNRSATPYKVLYSCVSAASIA